MGATAPGRARFSRFGSRSQRAFRAWCRGAFRARTLPVTLDIQPIPCLKDNYAYLIHAQGQTDAVVVDPSEEAPVTAALKERGLSPAGSLATHHHHDHVGGIAALVAAARGPVWVAAHAQDKGRVPEQTAFVEAPEDQLAPTALAIAGVPLLAMHIPGHTRAAIAWALVSPDGTPTDIFTGDTLFGAGCGRLFEGTPAQMYRSLQALTAGPAGVRPGRRRARSRRRCPVRRWPRSAGSTPCIRVRTTAARRRGPRSAPAGCGTSARASPRTAARTRRRTG